MSGLSVGSRRDPKMLTGWGFDFENSESNGTHHVRIMQHKSKVPSQL